MWHLIMKSWPQVNAPVVIIYIYIIILYWSSLCHSSLQSHASQNKVWHQFVYLHTPRPSTHQASKGTSTPSHYQQNFIQNANMTLQEVTRLYGIRESGSEEATAVGSKAWEQLRYHLQEIIHPLLTSKYTLSTGSGRPSPALSSPIFGSPHAMSFQQWLTSWECSLIDMLKSERATQVRKGQFYSSPSWISKLTNQ